ncbi:DNA double-strand break repair nuclease NurA [Halorarius litoreus]|uniref:DNA double-strand break repair nuclease NurA n=1 Tax=Halorarius litoreus TaxID=2962676 RepID=UPI0020CC2D64|nr:DNA double-strand break repair nuclease NurA [Halorarius litoreus]
MTLDPVHFKAISRLAGRVQRTVDEDEHRDFAATVWNEYLDPLYADGEPIIEPMGEQRRRRVDIEDVSLEADRFPTSHGLDSGTINPTTFKNGLVVDVAQAAMSKVPSDLELHRGRTMVVAVHSNDVTVALDNDWHMDDAGYVRQRLLHVPQVDRSMTAVVHELALYLAEITHARDNAPEVDDLLVMDGPIYPKGLLTWANRDPELGELLREEEQPQRIIQSYVRMVERFIEQDVPLIGFVKNPASRLVTRTVRQREGNAPWLNDAAFFSQVLERGAFDEGVWTRETDELTFTNWFVSRGGTDGTLSATDLPYGVERVRDPADYEVTFSMVYDPRTDTIYRVEAPRAFTEDADLREDLLRHVLKGIAVERGPPEAVGKADSLAKIGHRETTALRRSLETAFDSEIETDYNDDRWGAFDY